MTGVCPDCGSPFPEDAALLGLCPQCLLSMALEDDEKPTLHGSSPGGILGERYQIREVLGRGGMGEVYRAFDVKLRVDVALKAVRPELSASEKARELLRQEVRSARGSYGPLWRVPETTKPPPHLRPRDEFVATLRSWTNLRVVPDPGSATGYKLEIGPFPGWADVPKW
jgi:hypothetical protein